MFKKYKYLLSSGLILLLTGCMSWLYVTVKPDNFLSMKSKYDAFLFGTYIADSGQSIYLGLNWNDPDIHLNRVYYNTFSHYSTNYFLVPMPAKAYSIKSVYVIDGPYTDFDPFFYNGPHFFVSYFGEFGPEGFYWGYYGNYYGDYYSQRFHYYPEQDYPYSFNMKLEKGKIYYFGRITIINGRFSIENRYDEDKALMLSSFRINPDSYDSLSNSDFVNLLK